MTTRRQALASLGALSAWGLAGRAEAEDGSEAIDRSSNDFDVLDLLVDGDRALGRRFTLLAPKHAAPGAALPLVVALHGLGETHDEKLGVHAWLDLYGLRAAYERLLHPPVRPVGRRGDFTDARLAEVNAALAQAPFRGLVVACPFTPNTKRMNDPARALASYAAWIADTVVPRARREAGAASSTSATTIVGCSMGGAVALEVFARRPEVFGGVGLVQGAVSAWSAPRHAAALAKAIDAAGPRDVHLLTSEEDPFLAGHRALAKELEAKKIRHELRVLPGPHDQPWLRDAGSIEMLLYQDRRRP